MRKVCAHWVPKLLQPDQKARRLDVCRELLQLYEEQGDHFLDRLVTQDESWLNFCEPTTKQSSMQWKHPDSPRPRKFLQKPSVNKVLYSFFWDSQGIILQWPVEKGVTINGQYHANLLRDHLHPALKRERRGRITAGVLLQQDNAPPHISQVGMAAVAELGYTLVPHPPYSPDLAPSDLVRDLVISSSDRSRRSSEVGSSNPERLLDLLYTSVCRDGHRNASQKASITCRTAGKSALKQEEITLKEEYNFLLVI